MHALKYICLLHGADGGCMTVEISGGPFGETPLADQFATVLKQLSCGDQMYRLANVRIAENTAKYVSSSLACLGLLLGNIHVQAHVATLLLHVPSCGRRVPVKPCL